MVTHLRHSGSPSCRFPIAYDMKMAANYRQLHPSQDPLTNDLALGHRNSCEATTNWLTELRVETGDEILQCIHLIDTLAKIIELFSVLKVGTEEL